VACLGNKVLWQLFRKNLAHFVVLNLCSFCNNAQLLLSFDVAVPVTIKSVCISVVIVVGFDDCCCCFHCCRYCVTSNDVCFAVVIAVAL
jgi:hypothetical protein